MLVLPGDPHEELLSSVDLHSELPLALVSCEDPFWGLAQHCRSIALHHHMKHGIRPVLRDVFRGCFVVNKRENMRHLNAEKGNN